MSKRQATAHEPRVIWLIGIVLVIAVVAAFVGGFEYFVRTGWIWLDVILLAAGIGFVIWREIVEAENEKQRETKRVEAIMARRAEWGYDTCIKLVQRTISTGMTGEMVRLSLGEPDLIDNRELTVIGEEHRWIYDPPRQGVAYIWFRNDRVIRIKR